MNEVMIERWNSRVTDRDILYHLGDFAWLKNRTRKVVEEILIRLNGKKYLCRGNHDSRLIKEFSEFFEDIQESYMLKYNYKKYFLSHYLHYVWPESHFGIRHLFGHSHGRINDIAEKHGKCLDVGVDNNNFYPFSIDEIENIMKTRPKNFNEK
jgi:calcineurin-like phosphoesterase family protein